MSARAQPWFSSSRERRLWIWTAVAVAGVYATLGLGSTLSGLLRHPGASAIAFAGCMLLVVVAVLTQGLRVRPGGREIGVALGIAAVYGMVFLRATLPERSHLFEYGVVAALLYEALLERASRGRRVPVPALLAAAGASLIGAVDEGIQALIPSRVYDPLDILFNGLAAGLAVAAMSLLGWARRRREGKRAGADSSANPN